MEIETQMHCSDHCPLGAADDGTSYGSLGERVRLFLNASQAESWDPLVTLILYEHSETFIYFNDISFFIPSQNIQVSLYKANEFIYFA